MDSSEEKASGGENLQFRPWLVQQISSGDYKDLEWIDSDKSRVFKLPWTKKNYPNWEEHHEIFRAWARHRSSIRDDPKAKSQHISLMKSNFRTILRKCSEIEELKNFHQLGLQTGNYKVYKVLTEEEAQIKRSRPKEAFIEIQEEPVSDIIEISSSVDIKDIQWLPDVSIPTEWIQASSSLGMAMLEADQPIKRPPSPEPILSPKPPKVKRTQATQTAPKDPQFNAKEVIFLSDPVMVDTDVQTETVLDDRFIEEEQPYALEVEDETVEIKSENTEGFHMLLEAAEIAADTGVGSMDDEGPLLQPQGPSIVDVLDKLNIPRDELLNYEVEMRYHNKEMWTGSYCEMDRGYRIHYDDKERKVRSYVSMKLPTPPGVMGKSFDTVLRNMNGGFVLKTDKNFNLIGKRLCQSRVFAMTSYSDFVTSEPIQMARDDEVTLFSYARFLQDWYLGLKDKQVSPKIDINLSFGKKPKHRSSKIFISLHLVPKAAASILDFVSTLSNSKQGSDLLKAAKGKRSSKKTSLDQVMEMFD